MLSLSKTGKAPNIFPCSNGLKYVSKGDLAGEATTGELQAEKFYFFVKIYISVKKPQLLLELVRSQKQDMLKKHSLWWTLINEADSKNHFS